MRNKHNKKRNTAFVFEALSREATVAIIKGDQQRKEKVVSIVRKHFTGDSLLKKDLECYRSLYENQELDETTSKKIVEAVLAANHAIPSKSRLAGREITHSRPIYDLIEVCSSSALGGSSVPPVSRLPPWRAHCSGDHRHRRATAAAACPSGWG